MKNSGQAGTEFDFLDFSFLLTSGQMGVTALIGETERGEIGKPKLIYTWEDYQKHFGGLLNTSDFPLMVKNYLEKGGVALVSPVGHYLDVNDATTLLGTKAAKVIDESSLSETLATATVTIDTVGTDAANVIVKANYIQIASYAIQNGDTPTLVATGAAAAINAGTGTHGYSATASAAIVTVTAPTGSGSSVNGKPVSAYTSDGTGTYTVTNLTGGVTAANAINTTFQAKEIGTAYNKVYFSITPSANKTPNAFDIEVGIDGYTTLTTTISDVAKTLTVDEQTRVNNSNNLINISSFSGDLRETAKTYLTGGVFDRTQIVPQDYIGTSIGKTGIYAFDDFMTFVKLAAPAVAYPTLDTALVNYADTRKDHLACIRTPKGLEANGWIDYRRGEGAYNHPAIDNWRGFMVAGDIDVNHPTTLQPVTLSNAADILGLISKKDQDLFSWYSAAGSKRGRLTNALGVNYNLGSPTRKKEADEVSRQGINTCIDHNSYGVVFWDNMTLSKSNSLFKFLNVAELLTYLSRTIKPLTDEELFDPNSIETWKTIFRKVYVVMDFVQSNQGIYNWRYEGDQDIDNIADATVNTSQSISNGAYLFNLYFQPTPALKFINARGIVTNAGVDFETLNV